MTYCVFFKSYINRCDLIGLRQRNGCADPGKGERMSASYGTPPVRVIVSQNDYMRKADALAGACGAPNPAGNEYGNLKSIRFF